LDTNGNGYFKAQKAMSTSTTTPPMATARGYFSKMSVERGNEDADLTTPSFRHKKFEHFKKGKRATIICLGLDRYDEYREKTNYFFVSSSSLTSSPYLTSSSFSTSSSAFDFLVLAG